MANILKRGKAQVGAAGFLVAGCGLMAGVLPAGAQNQKVAQPLERPLVQLQFQELHVIRGNAQLMLSSPAVAQGSVAQPLPEVTLEIRDATLKEAAAQLSEAAKLPMTVAEPVVPRPEAPKPPPDLPKLDYARKASFSWKGTPLAKALREFCRAYECTLSRDYRGSVSVLPGAPPQGPVAKVGGFALEVARITFGDYRSTTEEPAESTGPRRSFSIQLVARAEEAEIATLMGMENLRVVDEAGRDVMDNQTDVMTGGPSGRTQLSAFPDERVQMFSLEWPYVNPRRFKRIEGDLVVARSVKRSTLELPVPSQGEQTQVQAGEAQIQFVSSNTNLQNFTLSLQLAQPPTLDLQSNGYGSPVQLLLEDGSRVPATLSLNYWNSAEGWMNGYATISARDLKSKPVKLLWNVLTKSEATRRYHFRWDNYPAVLTPEDAGSAPSPHPGKPVAKPAAKPVSGKPPVKKPMQKPAMAARGRG